MARLVGEDSAVQECLRESWVVTQGMGVVAERLVGASGGLGGQGSIEVTRGGLRVQGDADAERGEGVR